ncbi:MAG: DUF1636 domain-containing protein [Pseudomonadota bacterium]
MEKPAQPAIIDLLVCTRCRRGEPAESEAPRPGSILAHALATRSLPAGVRLREVECLSNCSAGCTIVLRAPDRWSYVYGGFDPEADVETILEGTAKYAASADGFVPWRERPEHFRRNCVARIPPLEVSDV